MLIVSLQFRSFLYLMDVKDTSPLENVNIYYICLRFKRVYRISWSLSREPISIIFLSLFIYFERRGRERWRKRISSRLHTVSTEPDEGLDPMNHEIMTWAKIKSWMLNHLRYPGTPIYSFKNFCFKNLHWEIIHILYS